MKTVLGYEKNVARGAWKRLSQTTRWVDTIKCPTFSIISGSRQTSSGLRTLISFDERFQPCISETTASQLLSAACKTKLPKTKRAFSCKFSHQTLNINHPKTGLTNPDNCIMVDSNSIAHLQTPALCSVPL